jgi:hypothetical protein
MKMMEEYGLILLVKEKMRIIKAISINRYTSIYIYIHAITAKEVEEGEENKRTK